MGRPKTDVRISLKGTDGTTIRVGLVRGFSGTWSVYRDGRRSSKLPTASSTRIGNLVGKWLMGQAAG
jgi:hypothetical protein